MQKQIDLFKGPPEKLEDLPEHLNQIERIFGNSKVHASTMMGGFEVTSKDTMETLLAKQEYVKVHGPMYAEE